MQSRGGVGWGERARQTSRLQFAPDLLPAHRLPLPSVTIRSEDGQSRDKQPFVFVSRLLHSEADHHVSPNYPPSPIPGQLTLSSNSWCLQWCRNAKTCERLRKVEEDDFFESLACRYSRPAALDAPPHL